MKKIHIYIITFHHCAIWKAQKTTFLTSAWLPMPAEKKNVDYVIMLKPARKLYNAVVTRETSFEIVLELK